MLNYQEGLIKDGFLLNVERNAEIIKMYFKPNKRSSIFRLTKTLINVMSCLGGYRCDWSAYASISDAMRFVGYKHINKRFSLTFFNNKHYINLLTDKLNIPVDIIRLILSKITVDLIYCNRCGQIHYITNIINHNTDFMIDNETYINKSLSLSIK